MADSQLLGLDIEDKAESKIQSDWEIVKNILKDAIFMNLGSICLFSTNMITLAFMGMNGDAH